MVDLAREFGVSVFIYSSSQLAQNTFDDSNYKCDFFAGKLAVEAYIHSLDKSSLGWMYVNTEHGDGYALLIAFVVEFSVLPFSWRLLSRNQDRSSLGYSAWV